MDINELIAKLEKLAQKETVYEKWSDYNAAENGNYGDAFSEGQEKGEIELAREILPHLKKLYPEVKE